MALITLACVYTNASAFSVNWSEYASSESITGIEVSIGGGTFTSPPTNFTQGDTGTGAPLAGWSSFIATNEPADTFAVASAAFYP